MCKALKTKLYKNISSSSFHQNLQKQSHPRGTLTFSYIRRLGSFFGVRNFEFHYFCVFRKMNVFWVRRYFRFFLFIYFFFIFFFFLGGGGGHHKIELYKRSFLCILGQFLRSRDRMGIFIWVLKTSNIFLGA